MWRAYVDGAAAGAGRRRPGSRHDGERAAAAWRPHTALSPPAVAARAVRRLTGRLAAAPRAALRSPPMSPGSRTQIAPPALMAVALLAAGLTAGILIGGLGRTGARAAAPGLRADKLPGDLDG